MIRFEFLLNGKIKNIGNNQLYFVYTRHCNHHMNVLSHQDRNIGIDIGKTI